jgi:hypothetical protein
MVCYEPASACLMKFLLGRDIRWPSCTAGNEVDS